MYLCLINLNSNNLHRGINLLIMVITFLLIALVLTKKAQFYAINLNL
jgi:hypothetical protein